MTTQPLGPACRDMSKFWNSVVEKFIDGGEVPRRPQMWAESYQGSGKGAVQWDALPEPFLGPLSKPRCAFLALNPGRAHLCFQGRGGIFAKEIREEYGSYSAWAASWPYLRDPWVSKKGKNRHHRSRFRFLRDWFDDQQLPCSAMVSFELYPWHSTSFDGRRLDVEKAKELIEKYVLEPVRELGVPVFAFGAPWFEILENIPDLEVVDGLGGKDGRSYKSDVKSRSVIVLEGSGGIRVIAAKHSGGAGPPRREETKKLRDAVNRLCG